jgi:hypothetical protein
MATPPSPAQMNALTQAAQALGAKVELLKVPGVVDTTNGFRTEVSGQTVWVFAFNRRGKNAVFHFIEILVENAAARAHLEVRKPAGWVGFCKRIKLLPELDLGDADFESKVFIASDESPEVLRATFAYPDIRAAVVAAVEGFEVLTISTHGVSVVSRAERVPSGASFAKAIESLALVAKAHPEVRDAKGLPMKPWNPLAWIFVPALGFGVGAVLLAKFYHSPLAQSGRTATVLCGLASVPIAVLVLYALLRGAFRAPAKLALGLWYCVIGMPFLGSFLAGTLNEVLDSSTPTAQAATVTQRKVSSGRRSRSYMLTLQPAAEKDTWARSVSRDLYDHTKIGDVMTAHVHKGAFGWEWATWATDKAPAPTTSASASTAP